MRTHGKRHTLDTERNTPGGGHIRRRTHMENDTRGEINIKKDTYGGGHIEVDIHRGNINEEKYIRESIYMEKNTPGGRHTRKGTNTKKNIYRELTEEDTHGGQHVRRKTYEGGGLY